MGASVYQFEFHGENRMNTKWTISYIIAIIIAVLIAGQVWGQGTFPTPEPTLQNVFGGIAEPTEAAPVVVIEPVINIPSIEIPPAEQPVIEVTTEPVIVESGDSDTANALLDIFESVVNFGVLSASAMAFIAMLIQVIKNVYLLIAKWFDKPPLSTTWVRGLTFVISITMIGLIGLLNRAGVDNAQIDLTLDSIVVLAGGVLGLVFGSGAMYRAGHRFNIAGFGLGSTAPTQPPKTAG